MEKIKMLEVGMLENKVVYFKMRKTGNTYSFNFCYDNKNYISNEYLYDMVSDGYNDLSSDYKLEILESYDSKPSEVIDDIIDDNVKYDIVTYISEWLDDNDISYDDVDYCYDTAEYYYTDNDSTEDISYTDIMKIELDISTLQFMSMLSLYHLVYVHDMVNTENYTLTKIQDEINKLWTNGEY